MSATPYLKPDTLKDAYDASVKYMEPIQRPFDEWERIASNRVHPAVKDPYPKNTDGTVAAIIQDQPRRTIQQLPTGKIDSDDPREWLKIVTNYHVNTHMIPRMRAQAEPLQKCWAASSKALTFGCQPSMTMLCGAGDDTYADFKLPDVRALLFEAHKLSFNDCNYFFIEAWYQPSDLDYMINQTKAAKDKGQDTYWKTDILEQAKSSIEALKDRHKNGDQKSRNISAEGILIVHAFQHGIGAVQYSYVPALAELDKNKTNAAGAVARAKPNPDPRGIPNVQVLYATVTLSNPCGRGVVELSGGIQNFIDSSLQMYQYTQALMMDPPLIARGVNKSKVRYKIGHVIELPNDPNAEVTPLKIETAALSNYASIMQLARSQILFLNNANDTSISSDVGGQTGSKTPTGIKAQQASLGISDNHFRKQVEAWWQEVIASSVNIEFNEKVGVLEIQLDKETAQQLMALNPEDPTVEGRLDPDSMLFSLDLSEVEQVLFKFTVDASSSQKQDNQAQLDALGGIAQQVDSSPLLQGLLQQAPDKMTALWNAMIAASGVEDPEKLKFGEDDVEQLKQQQEAQQQQQQAMEQQQMQMQQQQAEQEAQAQQDQQAQAQAAQEQQMAMKAQDHQMKLEQSQQAHEQAMATAQASHAMQMEAGQAKADQASALGDQKIVAAGGKPAKKPMAASTKPSQPVDGVPQPAIEQPQGNGTPSNLPNMDGKVEPQELDNLSQDEQGVIDRLFQEEFPEEYIEQAILWMRQGEAPEDIVPKLTKLVQSREGQA